MPEPVDAWWQRRRFSMGRAVPYEPGTFRQAWRSYPVLVRWYHPDLNRGILLSQVPLAADVWLQWQCDAGHLFIATPSEQRFRPGRERRRSSWCPECLAAATGRTRPRLPVEGAGGVLVDPMAPDGAAPDRAASHRSSALTTPALFAVETASPPVEASRQPSGPDRAAAESAAPGSDAPGSAALDPVAPDPVAPDPVAAGPAAPDATRPRGAASQRPVAAGRTTRRRPTRELCTRTPAVPVGEPFASVCAPAPASAVEGRLRASLVQRLEFEAGFTAVRLGRLFFDHREAWPDIVLGELRIAIEYDSTGRHGLEHVGDRRVADERKDRCLRAAGWEVVRIRTGSLPPIGPFDLVAAGVTAGLIDRLVDRLRDIRGPLLVDAYLRP